ncbi:MAG: hypothetical protein J5I93_26480 [Pirellulaceae bacterium]|nr:hypothetical protein [Pirellulaceae bacterium]
MSGGQPRPFESGMTERREDQRPSLEEELALAEGMSPDAVVPAAEPYGPTASYRGPLPPVVARLAEIPSPAEPPLVALQAIPAKPKSAEGNSSGWVVGLLLAVAGGGLLALLFCGGLALVWLLRHDSSPAAHQPPVFVRTSPPVYRPPVYRPPDIPRFDSQAMHDELQRTMERQRAESQRMMDEIRERQHRRMQEHEQLMRQQIEDSRRQQQELIDQLRRTAP